MALVGPFFANDKAQISDALAVSQRIQAAAAPPPPPQQPAQAQVTPLSYQLPAGAPNPGAQFGMPPAGPPDQQQQPMASRFGGAQVGLQGRDGDININLGPGGEFEGANAHAKAGRFDVSAALNDALQLQEMQARYSSDGPVSVSGGYDRDKGFGGDVEYKKGSVSASGGYNQRDGGRGEVKYQKGAVSAGGGYDKRRGPYANVGVGMQFQDGGGVWTRKEGQNPEGGLNAKGRASLKAQGQDIKPPVSAKQAKKSPKAAARRSSFCARMGGMPGAMTDDNGKPTRKALALRKWDC